MPISITSLEELSLFAESFLSELPQGACVTLKGTLGAGKTTFVRACVDYLATDTDRRSIRVTSPSFVIHQRYPGLRQPVEHFDLYRLENVTPAALIEIGYYDALEQARKRHGFVFVEWPEKVVNESDLRAGIHVEFALEGTRRLLSITKDSKFEFL